MGLGVRDGERHAELARQSQSAVGNRESLAVAPREARHRGHGDQQRRLRVCVVNALEQVDARSGLVEGCADVAVDRGEHEVRAGQPQLRLRVEVIGALQLGEQLPRVLVLELQCGPDEVAEQSLAPVTGCRRRRARTPQQLPVPLSAWSLSIAAWPAVMSAFGSVG